MTTQAYDQNDALAAFRAEADASRIDPLSLVDEFDLPLAQYLGITEALPLDDLLIRLEKAGLISADSAERRWRWLAEFRTAAQADFVARSPDTARAVESRLAVWFADRQQATAALAHAMSSSDWPVLVDVIESFTRQLVFDAPFELARALAMTPLEALQDRPMGLAIRHTIPFPPLDPATMPAPELLSVAQRQLIGSSDQARRAIETRLAIAIMYRSKGRYRQAVAYGDEMAALMKVAQAAGNTNIDDLIAGGLLQIAITRGARGEYDAAIDLLLEAYRFAPVSERTSVLSEMAGRLALAYAMRGEVGPAAHWLTIESGAPKQAGLLAQHGQLPATTGRALLAVSTLDGDGVAAAIGRIVPGPLNDDWWALALYARACSALGWGDRLAVLDEIGQARATRSDYVELQRNDAIAGPLLLAAEANLLMSLGRGSQAWAILNYGTLRHSLIDVARARLALLTGDPDATLTIAASVTASDAAVAGELTLLSAAALVRLDRRDEAAVAFASSIAFAGDRLFTFAQIPRRDLVELIELSPGSSRTVTPDVLARLPDIFPADISLIQLTEQEQITLDGLAQDKGLAAIAAELHLSEGTIKTHRRHLYRKLGVNSRDAALTTAAELGLLSWPE